MIPRWRACGYSVHLVFLKLDREGVVAGEGQVACAGPGKPAPAELINIDGKENQPTIRKILQALGDEPPGLFFLTIPLPSEKRKKPPALPLPCPLCLPPLVFHGFMNWPCASSTELLTPGLLQLDMKVPL